MINKQILNDAWWNDTGFLDSEMLNSKEGIIEILEQAIFNCEQKNERMAWGSYEIGENKNSAKENRQKIKQYKKELEKVTK